MISELITRSAEGSRIGKIAWTRLYRHDRVGFEGIVLMHLKLII